MNAKEISDETLESITPAADDLLVVYDTSAGTTGKSTLADIAPVVAENIDIADLSTVTPAAADALMIYDASAGTTGKATIADIAPVVAENIDIADLSTVTPAADDTLIIGDTSAGTTGKATIADIAPVVAENIDIETGTATLGSGISGSVTWEKYGKLVKVKMQDVKSSSSSIGASQSIATGLPNPTVSQAVTMGVYPSTTREVNFLDLVTRGTLLQTGIYSLDQGVAMSGTFVYFSKD